MTSARTDRRRKARARRRLAEWRAAQQTARRAQRMQAIAARLHRRIDDDVARHLAEAPAMPFDGTAWPSSTTRLPSTREMLDGLQRISVAASAHPKRRHVVRFVVRPDVRDAMALAAEKAGVHDHLFAVPVHANDYMAQPWMAIMSDGSILTTDEGDVRAEDLLGALTGAHS